MRHWVLPDCTCWRSPIPSSSWWGHSRLCSALVAAELLCFQFTARLDRQCLTRLISVLFAEARRAGHWVKCLPSCSPGERCWALSGTIGLVAFGKAAHWGCCNFMWPQKTRQNFSVCSHTSLCAPFSGVQDENLSHAQGLNSVVFCFLLLLFSFFVLFCFGGSFGFETYPGSKAQSLFLTLNFTAFHFPLTQRVKVAWCKVRRSQTQNSSFCTSLLP